MHDTLYCPICNNKLKNKKLINYKSYFIGNISNYIQRTCTNGMNHTLQFITEEKTKKVHSLKTSLNELYSRFIEIDFVNYKSRISFFNFGKPDHLIINNIFDLDFPNLKKIKEKVEIYSRIF